MTRYFSLCGALLASTMLAPMPAFAQQDAADADTVTDVVVIRGTHIPEPQRRTSQVATFIQNEDLQRQGDGDAAIALTRLSGLSIVSGRFAYVRGLGERYSLALLNGSPLPSPEPLRRTVPLDLFPTNLLDGIEVQKTFSANFPGEFGGGVIQLNTLRTLSENFLSVSTGLGVNTEVLDQDGIFVHGSDADWSGYDDGLRDIPAPLAAVLDSDLRLNEYDDDIVESVGESLVNSPLSVIQRGELDPDYNIGFEAGRYFDLDGVEISLIGAAGFKSGWDTTIRSRQYQLGGAPLLDLETTQTAYNADVYALGALGLLTENHTLQTTLFYTHSTTKEAQIDEGYDFDAPISTGQGFYESSSWVERELAMLQFTGEHFLGPVMLNWRVAGAESNRNAPYQRDLKRYVGDDGVPAYSSANRYSISFSEVDDQVVSGGADLTYEADFGGGRDGIFSVGFDQSSTERDFEYLGLRFAGGNSLPDDVMTARPDYLFSPDNIDPARFVLQEIVTPNDSYAASLDVTAFYAQADLNVIPFVRTTFGVRYEEAEQEVETFDRFGNSGAGDVNLQNEYWLPSVLATWNFAEDLQLRLGYSQTIARPQFRELAQSSFFDPETDRSYQGNRGLVDSELKNFDARLEYYMGRNAFVTLSGFYKEIENPIEEILFSTESSAANRTTFINSPRAVLWGSEFEFRRYFQSPIDMAWLRDRDWLLSFNYTYTHSEVEADEGDLVFDGISGTYRDAAFYGVDGSQLQGTPEHIANLQTGWQSEWDEFTVLVGWVDERILQRGTASASAEIPDVIEDPGVQLDLTYRRFFMFRDNEMTLTLSGRNLLGEEHAEYQYSEGAGRTEYNTYDRGQSFSVSLSTRF